MHELGHNLNLKHGGNEHLPNFKPNYESIMNYMFQTIGLRGILGHENDHSDLATGEN
jgi:hypothetical protein